MREFIIRFASMAASGAVGALAVIFIGAAAPDHDTLTVRRLNVVNEDGSLALVIANAQSLPGIIRNDAESGNRRGIPGILFYDNNGDEVGGLIYPHRENGGNIDAGVSLSFDQTNSGQAINLIHWRNGDFVRSGLRVSDFATDRTPEQSNENPAVRAALRALQEAPEPEQEALYYRYLEVLGEQGFQAERIYIGSEGARSRTATIELKDSRSRPRIRLSVDENDQPRIQVLNERGEVVREL